jgi:hypothetical protein
LARKAARDVTAVPAMLSPVIHRFLEHLLYALLVAWRWHIVQQSLAVYLCLSLRLQY